MSIEPSAAPRLPLLRLRWIALLALAFALPFLFVTIPPITDVPGHMGRFAVQTAPEGSPLFRYFSFEWTLVLNLAADLIVEALEPLLGLYRSTWLVSAATPVITAAAILVVARALNPKGAHALPWALIFVYNYCFLWGFLNYALAASLALLGFGIWALMERRPLLRGMLFFLLPPFLFIGHGVGGALLPIMAGSWEVWRRGAWRPSRWNLGLAGALARSLWPFLGCLLFLGFFVAYGDHGAGPTHWRFGRKLEDVVSVVKDRNIFLDIGTAVAAAAVLALGARWGARYRGGSAGPVIALLLLFVLAPAQLNGSDRVDTRILPYAAMLALALQDWSGVEARRRLRMMQAGIALLVLRLAVTALSFVQFEQTYDRELAALDHVRPGSRLLHLTEVDCRLESWPRHRLEHISNLATPIRGAWINSHWAVDGLHLLRVRYRPAPGWFRDPTFMVWPQRCIDSSEPYEQRSRRTAVEVVPRLPLDRADYLWLVRVQLPPEGRDPRLQRIWSSPISELYAIRPAAPRD